MRFDTFSQFNPTVDLAMLRSGVPLWQLEFFPPFVSKDGDSTAFCVGVSKRSATWVESQFPAKGPLSDDVKHLVLVGVQPMRATNDGGG